MSHRTLLPDFSPTVLVSREGSRSVEVVRFDGIHHLSNRDAVGAYFAVRTARNQPESRIGVLFSGTVLAVPNRLDIPSTGDQGLDMLHMSLAAVGEHLDRGGELPPTPRGTPAQDINCFSSQVEAWRDRVPATDDEIERYLKARVTAGWKFGHENVVFGAPDLLRLHTDMRDLKRIAKLEQGSLWSMATRDSGQVILTPEPALIREQRAGTGPDTAPPPTRAPGRSFVDSTRLAELHAIRSTSFDLRKLVRMCEEANGCFAVGYYFAVAMLCRAILDHVPPIFGVKAFSEVANNYAGSRSFKESMSHLDRSVRKIADSYLHVQIRAHESLPTEVQVDCARDLDVLLGEVARVLRGAAA